MGAESRVDRAGEGHGFTRRASLPWQCVQFPSTRLPAGWSW